MWTMCFEVINHIKYSFVGLIQDSTSQKIFDLEKLVVLVVLASSTLVVIFGSGMRYYLRVRVASVG